MPIPSRKWDLDERDKPEIVVDGEEVVDPLAERKDPLLFFFFLGKAGGRLSMRGMIDSEGRLVVGRTLDDVA